MVWEKKTTKKNTFKKKEAHKSMRTLGIKTLFSKYSYSYTEN